MSFSTELDRTFENYLHFRQDETYIVNMVTLTVICTFLIILLKTNIMRGFLYLKIRKNHLVEKR